MVGRISQIIFHDDRFTGSIIDPRSGRSAFPHRSIGLHPSGVERPKIRNEATLSYAQIEAIDLAGK